MLYNIVGAENLFSAFLYIVSAEKIFGLRQTARPIPPSASKRGRGKAAKAEAIKGRKSGAIKGRRSGGGAEGKMNERENLELGELIVRISQGDTGAIGEIFARVGPAMLAAAASYLKNRADAEDVVQESLVIIVTKAGSFRENKNAKAWINAIVYNTAKNKLRSSLRRRESGLDEAQELNSCYDEDTLIVNEIFEKLTKAERKLVIYRYWYQCSLSELTHIFHCSKSTVKYRLDKLEDKLRKFYQKD